MSNFNKAQKRPNGGYRGSIRKKLMLIFLALSLVPTLAVGLFTYLQNRQTIEQITREDLSRSAELTDSAINRWISERMDDMQVIAGLARVQTLDTQKAGEAIQEYFDQWKIYENIGLSDLSGYTIYRADGKTISIADRDYFQAALKGETVISDALISKASGKLVFVIATPVLINGKVAAVVSGTLPTTTFNEFLNQLQKGKTGEAYLVNSQGLFLTPSRFAAELINEGRIQKMAELELKAENEGVKSALAGQGINGTYKNYRGQVVFGEYRPIAITGWALVVEQSQSEAFEKINRLGLYTLALLVLIGMAVLLVAVPVARMFARPISQITRAAKTIVEKDLSNLAVEMKALAQGDLTRKLHFEYQPLDIRLNDEIGQMAATFNLMLEHFVEIGSSFDTMTTGLRGNIAKIQNSAMALQFSSSHLALAANQAGEVTGQIATTVQTIAESTQTQSLSTAQTFDNVEKMSSLTGSIADGAVEQAAAVEKTAALAMQIGFSMQEVSAGTQKVAQNSSETVASAGVGAKIVQENIQVMQDVHQKVNNCHQIIAEMSRHSNQIGSIIATIQEIASQTNLLSLNAAIEAARAGSSGKGFAVVADEVRRLADRTARAAKEVSLLISGIQNSAGQAMVSIEESVSGVNQGVAYAGHTNQALDKIVQSSQALLDQAKNSAQNAQQVEKAIQELMDAMQIVSVVVDQNQKATRDMAIKTGEIVHLMDEVAQAGTGNSASTEQLASAAEEMSAQVEEVTASAHALDEMSQALKTIVASFRLEA